MNSVFSLPLFASSDDKNAVSIEYVENLSMPWGYQVLAHAYLTCDVTGKMKSGKIKILKSFEGDHRSINIIAHELVHILGFYGHMKKGLMVPGPELITMLPLESFITKELQENIFKKYGKEETYENTKGEKIGSAVAPGM